MKISCGVPQGSLLGSLLFFLYINDLPHCLRYSKVKMFVDDTNITSSAETFDDLQRLVNVGLNNINKWLLANKLTFNLTKTEFIIIGSENRRRNLLKPCNFKMGKHELSQVKSTKSLGLIPNDRLTWGEHDNSFAKKVSKAIGGLRIVRKYVPFHTLMTLYKSLIQPLFDYCSTVWNSINVSQSERLQKLQQSSKSRNWIIIWHTFPWNP